MTKDEAIAKVIAKLAPHLNITLKQKLDNPIPDIVEVINSIDEKSETFSILRDTDLD